MQKIVLFFGFLLSTEVVGDFLILECSKVSNWIDNKDIAFSLQIGTSTKKVLQVFQNRQLQMQLKETVTHFEIGQYTDASETTLIPVLKVNKETLMADYSNLKKDPIFCKKV
jgi:hypothetical protein